MPGGRHCGKDRRLLLLGAPDRPIIDVKANLSAFELTTWTSDPRAISKVVWLHVAENESFVTAGEQLLFSRLQPSLRRKNVLMYRVTVHIHSIADFVPADLSPPPPPPTTDNGDSGQDGNPDRHHF